MFLVLVNNNNPEMNKAKYSSASCDFSQFTRNKQVCKKLVLDLHVSAGCVKAGLCRCPLICVTIPCFSTSAVVDMKPTPVIVMLYILSSLCFW